MGSAKRRIPTVCASLIAVTAGLATVAVPQALATGPTETLANLQAAVSSASPGGTVALTGTVTGATGTGLSIPSGENVTLDLAGYSMTVDATGSGDAGVDVPATSGLTIEDSSNGGTGTLNATGDDECAGIGGDNSGDSGAVTIKSGTINATGGGDSSSGGPGIGSGFNTSEGNITISGGTVTATGQGAAAGIGGESSTAVITITGGSVTASGGSSGAGIGGGDSGMPATIDISGGTLTATGGDYAAGIGSGYDAYTNGNITIAGGAVRATGGLESAGIGGGYHSSVAGNITISSGTVSATGGDDGPGIGNDNGTAPNFAVTLSGGITGATGGTDAPGIGEGDLGTGTVSLNVEGARISGSGTDGGSSTGGGTVSTISDDPGAAVSYFAADTPGVGGHAVITFSYPVSFDLDGHGSAIGSQLVAYNTAVTQPSAPTAGGYTFGGWYSDAALTHPFSFSAVITPTAPVTLYAEWTVAPATVTTPTTTTTTPAPTPTPKPKPAAKVINPTIRAHVKSATKPAHGWYRSAVRISFTCRRGSAALKGRCPATVTLSKNGADQKLTRTIRARDGGHAKVTVRGINIDTSAPKVSITGIRAHAIYVGTGVPAAHCAASDKLSGVASCSLQMRREGQTVIYLARATSKAGVVASTTATIRLSAFALSGVIPSLGAYTVHRQSTYTFYVVAATQPRYVDAAPWPAQPSGASVLFTRAGSSDGQPLWKVSVTIDTPPTASSRWNLGYLVGGTLHSATVTVEP
jgi:uncharacterized repeat protein (TIGR02543 family)